MRILSKINIIQIIKDHFNSLYDNSTKKIGFDDILTFLFLPLSFTSYLHYIKFSIDKDSIDVLIGALSIMVGLLFNALVIILDLGRKIKESIRDHKSKIETPESEVESNLKRMHFIRTVNANISFSILISFSSIFVMLLGLIKNLSPLSIFVINTISFFFVTLFFITFLMILKRVYKAFEIFLED
jgi:hypothetical protein